MTRTSTLWILFFSVWSLFLTGALSFWIEAPGAYQAWKLRSVLQSKREKVKTLQVQAQSLEQQTKNLQNNKFAQLVEIRKVLGYVAKDELVFEFHGDVQ